MANETHQQGNDHQWNEVIPISDVPKVLQRHFDCRIHVSQVYRWVMGRGCGVRLPSIVIGGRRYIYVSDLQVWLANEGMDDNRVVPPWTASRTCRAKQNHTRFWVARQIAQSRHELLMNFPRHTCPDCGRIDEVWHMREQDWCCKRCGVLFCEGDAAALLTQAWPVSQSSVITAGECRPGF